jgi:hypothetical protein
VRQHYEHLQAGILVGQAHGGVGLEAGVGQVGRLSHHLHLQLTAATECVERRGVGVLVLELVLPHGLEVNRVGHD